MGKNPYRCNSKLKEYQKQENIIIWLGPLILKNYGNFTAVGSMKSMNITQHIMHSTNALAYNGYNVK